MYCTFYVVPMQLLIQWRPLPRRDTDNYWQVRPTGATFWPPQRIPCGEGSQVLHSADTGKQEFDACWNGEFWQFCMFTSCYLKWCVR